MRLLYRVRLVWQASLGSPPGGACVAQFLVFGLPLMMQLVIGWMTGHVILI